MKPLTEEQMKRVYELLDTIVRPETDDGNVVDAVEEAQVLLGYAQPMEKRRRNRRPTLQERIKSYGR